MTDQARYSASATSTRTKACGRVRSDRRRLSSQLAFRPGSSPSGPPIVKLMLVAVGHRPPTWAQAAFDDYAKRFPPELKFELKAVKAEPLPPVVRITLRAAGAARDATAFFAVRAAVAVRFAGAAARASAGRLAETMRRTVPRAAGSLSSPPS